WLLFAVTYFYLFPSVEYSISELKGYDIDKSMSDHLISGYYAGYYQSLTIFVIGTIVLLISIYKSNNILTLFSLLTGALYSFYRTQLSISIEQFNIGAQHGISVVYNDLVTIFNYSPYFLYMELLLYLYLIGTFFTVYCMYITHKNAYRDTGSL
uniref:hypothetical protein n=1 Tax=Vibrio sp. TaxID=678 RepID=UPI003D115889